jgi:hypothetical protein
LNVIEGLDPVYLKFYEALEEIAPVMGKEKLGLSQGKGRLTVLG